MARRTLPDKAQRLYAPYPVDTPRGRGAVVAWTYWGSGRIRWYWVAHGSALHAYSGGQLRRLYHASTCQCTACQLVQQWRPAPLRTPQ